MTAPALHMAKKRATPSACGRLLSCGALALLSALGACATSKVMLGTARPPISPDQVVIYTSPPKGTYEQIARIDTSSQWSLSLTAQQKTDAVISRLKTEAAKLGANGVLLQGMGDRTSGSIGTGAGGASYGGSSGIGGGVGINLGMNQKIGAGIAIYVPSP